MNSFDFIYIDYDIGFQIGFLTKKGLVWCGRAFV